MLNIFGNQLKKKENFSQNAKYVLRFTSDIDTGVTWVDKHMDEDFKVY